jgi:hypothetical protein
MWIQKSLFIFDEPDAVPGAFLGTGAASATVFLIFYMNHFLFLFRIEKIILRSLLSMPIVKKHATNMIVLMINVMNNLEMPE